MADNPSSSPQIPQNPNGLASPHISPSPSIDLTSISSTQLPPLHPQNPNPNPNPSPNLNPNPNPIMTASASSPSFQNLQRSASGSVARLTQQQQQQLKVAIAARQYASGGAQMSFGGSQIRQQAGMARIGQPAVGQQIPMLPGQTIAQFNNMQAHMLFQQPRQKAGLVQGLQFNSGNSPGQALQGMQAMGMMGSLRMNQQLRANGPPSYDQRFSTAQIRQHQLMSMQMQNALASPQKPPGQSLQRRSSLTALNPQFSGLTQTGQSTSVQNALAQPWLKQMQQAISFPVSPSNHLQQQQRQLQAFSPQQPSSSQLQHQNPTGLNQHQIIQLVQQHVQLGSPRQPQSQQQQLFPQQQPQMQQQQQQQQSPRVQGSGFQKSVSLTGSQPGTPASVTTNTGGNSSQGAETSNQLLGKRKLQDLVSQVDPLGKLDPTVEDLLLEIADDFIDSVTTFACRLAKHRKSSTLESKDLLLHLEKNLHLMIPGFTKEGQKYQKEPLAKDVHTKRLEALRASMESQPFENDPTGVRSTSRLAIRDSSLNRPMKPSLSSEQLVLSGVASQMLQNHSPYQSDATRSLLRLCGQSDMIRVIEVRSVEEADVAKEHHRQNPQIRTECTVNNCTITLFGKQIYAKPLHLVSTELITHYFSHSYVYTGINMDYFNLIVSEKGLSWTHVNTSMYASWDSIPETRER